jgi:aryl-alcohol dehydrogenase-like predicted oxidoreductase
MRRVTLPGTDLEVSRICLGTDTLGSTVDRDASFGLLDAYAAAGGTFLDTAHVYADWVAGERHRSEKTIGQWLRASGLRDRMVIATKGGHPDLADMSTPRLSPAEIVADLDGSLECLGVDRIDLYWLHRDDSRQPVDRIVDTLDQQVRAGKIRYFGCSNWQPHRIRQAHDYAVAHGRRSFVASQVFWSLAVPNAGVFGDDIAIMDGAAYAFYAAAGMAVVAFTAQARGFFARADAVGVDLLKPELRRDFENDENVARLARARRLARDLGSSITAIVLAYIASRPLTAIPIIGPKTVEQLRESLAEPDLVLTPQMVRYLTTGEGW